MYIPKKFELKDKEKIISFIKEYSFGTIICTKENIPIATHLPFILEERNQQLFLIAHMAIANEQWQLFTNQKVLIIFQEPHAYISPTLYEKKQNVPTWNYLAIHVYGNVKLFDDTNTKIEILEKTILNFEPNYIHQWQQLDLKYKTALLDEMVAFEIEIENIQAKEKLSQNKSKKERENIANHLSKSTNNTEKEIGKRMQQ